MKTKKIDKKLGITKSTVSNLDRTMLERAKGGKLTVTFLTCDYSFCGDPTCLCTTDFC